MPFGLRNAPATFQHHMRIALSGKLWSIFRWCGFLFLHLVWPFTNTVFHFQPSLWGLSHFKCGEMQIWHSYGDLSGLTCGTWAGETCRRNSASSSWFPCSTVKKKSILGMCGYYRGFCRNFYDVVAPLTDLVGPEKTFVWSPACQAAFECAKALLCITLVLSCTVSPCHSSWR